MSIVEFKYNTFKKLQADSLDNKQKLDFLVKQTATFVDESSTVRKGIDYLTLLFVVQIAIEFTFLILLKRNSGRQD
jgi:hypothetical protein